MSKWIQIETTIEARQMIAVGWRVKMLDYDEYSCIKHRGVVSSIQQNITYSFDAIGRCGYEDCDRGTHRYYYDQVIAVKPPKKTKKGSANV